MSQAKAVSVPAQSATARRRRTLLLLGGGAIAVVVIAVLAIRSIQNTAPSASTGGAPATETAACQLKPFRQDQAASLIKAGAVLAYERNGGSSCLDELYAVYPDGRIVGDDGTKQIEKQVTPADVDNLLASINDRGWFTEEMYDTWHTPCGQCYGYYLTVVHQGQAKTVKAVDGGTDAPADYWQVVSLINGVIPKFTAGQ